MSQTKYENGIILIRLRLFVTERLDYILRKLIINDIKATLHDRLEKGDKSPVLIIFDEFSRFLTLTFTVA